MNSKLERRSAIRFGRACRARQVRVGALSAALLCSTGCGIVGLPYTSTPLPPPVSSPLPPPVSDLAFGYVESAISGTLSQFQISPSGVWSSVTPASFPIPRLSESLAVDPGGRFVYVANADNNTVSQYVIDLKTGALSPNRPATVPTGTMPQWLAIDPLSRFLYAADSFDGTISMYTIDQTTGALHPTVPAAIPFVSSGGSYPSGLVVDPGSGFLYVVGGDGVDTYAIDPATGLLIPASLQ